ncbi:MAG: response regulator transcription factor [Lachnospiraceae bacterium]|nr:response regulator transcription factor [Lachnospiraceae bacterium]MDE7416818.1 response regulator transcription factor [Lachnospiraceae bacterium]
MYDILMVEDEEELAKLLSVYIERAGYKVQRAASGEEALACLQKETAKLILLDITLPGMDGFAVCREMRKAGSMPILMISARVGKEDQLNGFRLGADDYIEKPVDPDLLMAKINSLFARIYGAMAEKDVLQSGSLMIDKSAHKVYKNKSLLELNVKEYELLLLLAENPGKTLDKDFLFNQIWGADSFSESQTLTVHINMLRNKIEENPKKPERIKTVWGVGYCYEEL